MAERFEDIHQVDGEHIARYEYALQFIGPEDVVLDCACGIGYGSETLAKKAKRVVGVDKVSDAGKENVSYVITDLEKNLPFADGSFDVVVSFETLEHIYNQDGLMREFARVLKLNGKLVLSTPNRSVISEFGNSNPFHISELTKPELETLASKYFTIESFSGQTLMLPISTWKHFLKSLKRTPGFVAIKRFVIDHLGLTSSVHRQMVSYDYTPIGPWDERSAGMVITARK
jgi:ubiquinone/menaquinone biosynthesis C-methylase UbiE